MRRLSPKELEIGMITAELVRTPVGQDLCPAGTEITRQLINRMKLYRVESVLVEGDAPTPKEESQVPPAPAPVLEVVQPPVQPKTHAEKSQTHSQKVAASGEFMGFQAKYHQATEKLKEVFHDATYLQKDIDTDELLKAVSPLFRERKTIVELFDMLYNMRVMDDAIYAHSLNVGLVSRMIGRWLRLGSHDLDIITVAGLLHDIGKIQIPEEVLLKPGKLTDEEFNLIQKHPKLGYDVLKNQPIDPRIKKVALMHHERCDGSGYPSHLEEDLIEDYAMIIGIADVYDAMTATRSYRVPLCPFQVISNFENDGYTKYNTKYILTFLKQIALAYQSNRVILSDGRGCNIVMLNPNALSRPMVQMDDGSMLDLDKDHSIFIKSIM